MRLAIVLVVVVVAVGLIVFQPWRAAAALLAAGQSAPNFQTQMVTADGVKPVQLSDYRGKTVVLYFYPKDFTPGCTKEACAFRDGYAKLAQAGIVLLGCSVQDSASHAKFIKKYNLPFPLLADPDKKIASAYGVANGIPALGLDKRVTYVIDPQGKIVKVYPKVDPSTHAGEIIAAYASGPKPAAESAPAAGGGPAE
jgi:peroxiredoxin Q/BCP